MIKSILAFTRGTLSISAERIFAGIPDNPESMPVAVFNILIVRNA